MPDATPSLSPGPDRVDPAAGPPRPAARPWAASGRWILAPVRYCRRRPRRALGLFVLALVVAAGAAAGGTHLWFRHHLNAARVAVDRGHNAEAIQHLVACRKVRPGHPEVLILMARVAVRTGQPEEAEKILDEYWAEHGDDEPLVFERLRLRAARGELETAAPALVARIQADGPDTAAAREALITGLINRFHWVQAAQAIDDWLARDPDNTTALLLRGKLHEQQAVTDVAAASYRRVLELDPDHDEARLRLATALLQRFYGEEALGHLEVLRQRMPDHPEVAYQWVVALGLQDRAAEAREALDVLLRAYPNHPGALAERGKYAAVDRDDATAADYLGRAVRLDPGNLATRYHHAQALARLGKAAEAQQAQAAMNRLKSDLDEMDRLIAGPLQATPNDPAIHHRIALIALRAGQPKEGLRWLQSALQVDPDHLPTHQTLAGYYNATGNPVLAARHRAIAQQLAGKQ